MNCCLRGSEILSMWRLKSPVMMKSCRNVAAVAMRIADQQENQKMEPGSESFWIVC